MITLDYYGVEGRGRTVTEAKKSAGEEIRRQLTGDYTPEIIRHRGCAILIYREPVSGWHYGIIEDRDGPRKQPSYGGCGDDTRDETIRHARRHLAQITWEHADGITPPAFLTDRHDRAEFASWAEFQVRYAKAKLLGMSDHEAHSAAGRNPSTPELVARLDAA